MKLADLCSPHTSICRDEEGSRKAEETVFGRHAPVRIEGERVSHPGLVSPGDIRNGVLEEHLDNRTFRYPAG